MGKVEKSLNVPKTLGSKNRLDSGFGRNLGNDIRFSEASLDFKEYTGLSGLGGSENTS